MNTSTPARTANSNGFSTWLDSHCGLTPLADLTATRDFACSLAAVIPHDSTLALSGDLGSGKTTFVRFFAEALGITEPVKSPTFNLYTFYDGSVRLLHCDAYRLKNGAEMDALLLDEYLVSPWLLCVEWPENVHAWMPADALHLHFNIHNRTHTVALSACRTSALQ